MKKTFGSWFLLILCNLMWSLQFTCIKLTQDQVGPYFTVWGPMLMATLLLIPFVRKEYSQRRRSWKELLGFGQLALLGVFPAQVFMTWGTQLSTASNAAIISLSLPILSALFAFLLLKETMNGIRWISFVMAIAGVILCSMGDLRHLSFGSKYATGNLLIFLAILGNAYYNVGIKKIAAGFSPMELVFYTYIWMVLLLTPLVLYYERDVFGKMALFTRDTWTGLLLLTCFHNFLSMVLFFRALKQLDAMQVALSNYLISFFGLPVAAIWLGEKLSLSMIAGGLLVLLSTLIITIVEYKMNQSAGSGELNSN